jgi:hypothetical protein
MNSNISNNQPYMLTGSDSSNQLFATGSQVSIVCPANQDLTPNFWLTGVFGEIAFTPVVIDPPDLTRPRIPGTAHGRILRMANDFNEPLK